MHKTIEQWLDELTDMNMHTERVVVEALLVEKVLFAEQC